MSDLQERINKAADDFIEHCDAVVILVSEQDSDYDTCVYAYRGNYHTALGLMETFKIKRLIDRIKEND
jgi:nucleoside 2-deoxyribosyltransferase